MLVSEVGAPQPELMHTGEEAMPPVAVTCNGFSVFLPFWRRALAPVRATLPTRNALRCGPCDRLAIGLVTAMVGL